MPTVNWLHFSDLHRGNTGDETRWPSVRAALTDFIRSTDSSLAETDFIVVTGDIAYSGSQKQYEAMDATIADVCAALKKDTPWFFVPGNHDIVRPKKTSYLNSLVRGYFSKDDDSLRAGLKSGDTEAASVLSRQFAEYKAWTDSSVVPIWEDHGVEHRAGLLPGDYCASFESSGLRVGIVGLNSAFLQLGDSCTKGDLSVEAEQLVPAEADLPQWLTRHHFSLLLLHHPLDWLHPQGQDEICTWIASPGRFAAIHHGHMHLPNSSVTVYGENEERVSIQAPSLFGLEHYGTNKESREFGFCHCTLNVDPASTDAELSVFCYQIVRRASGKLAVAPDTRQESFRRRVSLKFPSPGNVNDHPVEEREVDSGEPVPVTIGELSACDSPPKIRVWVGRDAELALLRGSAFPVVGISGIGGQGKSYLAAKLIDEIKNSQDGNSPLWDWRDCREQGLRLHAVLVSQISRFADRVLETAELSECSIAQLVDTLFNVVGDRRILFVYDNVDSYVDGNTLEAILGLNHLLSEALRREHNCRFVLTCRPALRADHVRYLQLPLGGLSHAETLSLFSDHGVDVASQDIRDLIQSANRLTRGHPLWLTLIAAQMLTRPGAAKRMILAGLSAPDTPLPRMVLEPIWDSLSGVEIAVLRILSEALRPHSDREIKLLVTSRRTKLVHVRDAIRKLVKANLVVIHSYDLGVDKYELHPLVRAFVNRGLSEKERSNIITRIVEKFYDLRIAVFGQGVVGVVAMSRDNLSLIFERAELFTNIPDYRSATRSLVGARELSKQSGRTEDYVRVAGRILQAVDLMEAVEEGYDGVHELTKGLAEGLSHLGEPEQAKHVLELYAGAIPSGSAFYVLLCDLQCYVHWYNKEYAAAIEWGTKGEQLKQQGGFDTSFDCVHNRALALRDIGRTDEALSEFLNLAGLEDVDQLRGKWPDKTYPGCVYGNIGRCLAAGGRHEEALDLYAMSFRRLGDTNDMHNYGYAAEWISESLNAIGDEWGSTMFLYYAKSLWEGRSPPRASAVQSRIDKLPNSSTEVPTLATELSHFAERWVQEKLSELS